MMTAAILAILAGVFLLVAMQNVWMWMVVVRCLPKKVEGKEIFSEDKEMQEQQSVMAKQWKNLLGYDGTVQEEEGWK